jgi:ribosome-interacting GTPase 1
MPTDDVFLFVSHVTEDRAAAMQVVEELERRGIRCRVTPRDIEAGKAYDDEIAQAIDASRALLLIFSEHCNANEYIRDHCRDGR